MKQLFLIILLLTACDSQDTYTYYDTSYANTDKYIEGNCQHKAMLALSTAISHGYEAEAVLGWLENTVSRERGYHVQVRAIRDGEWYWLHAESLARVKFYEEFGEWLPGNKLKFILDKTKEPMNLAELAYQIEFEWWDLFR